METKHTPGPWSRNIKANGKYPVVFAGRNQHVAVVHQQKDGAETEANIDLVAAAPDLLAALVCAINALEGRYPWPVAGKFTKKEACAAAVSTARAAIARAKGEA